MNVAPHRLISFLEITSLCIFILIQTLISIFIYWLPSVLFLSSTSRSRECFMRALAWVRFEIKQGNCNFNYLTDKLPVYTRLHLKFWNGLETMTETNTETKTEPTWLYCNPGLAEIIVGVICSTNYIDVTILRLLTLSIYFVWEKVRNKLNKRNVSNVPLIRWIRILFPWWYYYT